MSLCKAIGQLHSVVPLIGTSGSGSGDEIDGDDIGSLMQKLKKGMLGVRPGFSPDHASGCRSNGGSISRDTLAIGFHVQLLDIGRETFQPLIIRDQGGRGPTHAVPSENAGKGQ